MPGPADAAFFLGLAAGALIGIAAGLALGFVLFWRPREAHPAPGWDDPEESS